MFKLSKNLLQHSCRSIETILENGLVPERTFALAFRCDEEATVGNLLSDHRQVVKCLFTPGRKEGSLLYRRPVPRRVQNIRNANALQLGNAMMSNRPSLRVDFQASGVPGVADTPHTERAFSQNFSQICATPYFSQMKIQHSTTSSVVHKKSLGLASCKL